MDLTVLSISLVDISSSDILVGSSFSAYVHIAEALAWRG
jgi:hypothetical protein